MEIGEQRGGKRQVVPELVRGTGQAGLTSPAEWIQQLEPHSDPTPGDAAVTHTHNLIPPTVLPS